MPEESPNIIRMWRSSLEQLLQFYESNRGDLTTFFPKLFLFFIALNIACYWWAIFTAFPELAFGYHRAHYFRVQFPVGFLGALFDSLSFFITIYIIRRALHTESSAEYIAHLSIDLLIAILATFWVLLVFILSGWLINSLFGNAYVSANSEQLISRQDRYENLLLNALLNPLGNLRNIYFGLIMGISASLPTCIHFYMFLQSGLRTVARQRVKPSS